MDGGVMTSIPEDVKNLAIGLEMAMVAWWERDPSIRGKGGTGFADPKVQHLYEVLCERIWHKQPLLTLEEWPDYLAKTRAAMEKIELVSGVAAQPEPTALTPEERDRAVRILAEFHHSGWVNMTDAGLVDVFATAERIGLWLKTGERTKREA